MTFGGSAADMSRPPGADRGDTPTVSPRSVPSGVLGVDPGLTGALALLTPDGGLRVWDMPIVDGHVNAHEVAMLVAAAAPSVAAVEQAHSMPKQGVASSFKFGHGYGTVLGVLAALQVPLVHAVPTRWTKAHGLTSDKEGHRRRAIETWPAAAHLFARKKDDGRADAALIALWASRQPMVLGMPA